MERCARCGGRLYAFWRKPGTHLEPPFCVVHNNAHRAKLLTEGWLVRLFAQV